jgi:septal ring factor EnvC (AmiA/AmiB activator)
MGLKFLKIFFFLIITVSALTANGYDYIKDKIAQADIYRAEIIMMRQVSESSSLQLEILNDSLKECNHKLNYLGELLKNVSYASLDSDERLILQNLEIENINDKISDLKNKFSQKIIWLYKFGPNYRDQLLLSSESLNEFYIRLKYLDKVSELRKSDFNRIRENQSLLEEKKMVMRFNYAQRRQYISTKAAAQKSLIDIKVQLEKNISSLEDLVLEYDRQIESKRTLLNELERNIFNYSSNFKGNFNNVPDYNGVPFADLKGKLILPVISTDIVTDYGYYINPKHKNPSFNHFVEVSIAKGSDVFSVADGIVKEIITLPSLKNVILIDHGEGFTSVYAITENLKVVPGQKVLAGQVISNTSDNVEGQRFRFELWHNNSPVDPKAWIKKS